MQQQRYYRCLHFPTCLGETTAPAPRTQSTLTAPGNRKLCYSCDGAADNQTSTGNRRCGHCDRPLSTALPGSACPATTS